MANLIHFLVIDSAYPINTRNVKIADSVFEYFSGSAKISFCAWNRENKKNPSPDNYYLYKKYSPGGKLLRKLFNLFGYFFFLKKYNKLIHPDVIIASHWDMLLLSCIFKKRSQILVYDNLDIPTATSGSILRILKAIERFAMINTNVIVLASRFYEPLYKNVKCSHVILENKPIIKVSNIAKIERDSTEKINLSYIGGIRYLEILKNLVSAVKDLSYINLHFHGEGHDLEALKKYCEGISNIYFTGRYEYDNIESFYLNSDIVWAVYPNKDYNVKYAISNKFHESLYYNVPCIFSDKTCLGNLVENRKIGFIVNPYSVDEIRELLSSISENRKILLSVKNKMIEYINGEEKDWGCQFVEFMNEINKLIKRR